MSRSGKYYPLSHPQKGIWYTEKFHPGTSIGNISATMRLKAPIDFALLGQAINLLIQNNDSMRLRIRTVDGTPCQYVSEHTERTFEIKDFTGQDPRVLYSWDKEQTHLPLYGEDCDLFRFVLLKIDENTCGYLVILHHIICDAWSMTLIGNEIMRYYLLLRQTGEKEQTKRPTYLKYVQEEEAYLTSGRCQKDAAFWAEQFDTLPEVVSVKPRKSRSLGITASRKSYLLPEKLCRKIREHAALSGASIFSMFMSALVMYIYRVTGKDDIVLGVPVLNRGNAQAKAAIGMFISTVPFRIQIAGEDSYSDFSRALTSVWMQLLRHQRYPLDDILADVRKRFGNVERLYDTVFSYQNAKFERTEDSENLNSRWHFNGHQNESLSIHINDRDDDGVIIINYDYLDSLFHTKDIDAMHDHYIRLLWHSLDSPGKQIKSIHMVSEAEKTLILEQFNDTRADFPRERTMLDFFESRAVLKVKETAICFGAETVTYCQLNARAEQIARSLWKSGVKCGDIVALLLERSPDMMASILAVWKAGAAYLPIDPQYPRERIAYMLEDSSAAAVIAMPGSEALEGYPGKWLDLGNLPICEEECPQERITPEDLAYVIYTSGSTGKPKGVMVEHRALVNRIHWMYRQYPLANDDIILQKTTYTFDVSVWELVWWFYGGVPMVFLPPGAEKHPDLLVEAIERHRVTTMHFVPSMLGVFLEYVSANGAAVRLSSLRRVFASGEALMPKHADRFYSLLGKNGTTLHNLYGPTEAAIDVSYYACPSGTGHDIIPIGKPIDNIGLYILDGHGNLQPIGTPGELYIGGVGLARGYLNRPELTAERFVENPFASGERLYRTGDLARWFPRGDIEYLGRLDHQVKIRGFRIEPGEIRSCLEQHPAVREAAVICRQRKSGDNFLAAYYVPDRETTGEELRAFLEHRLPDYMVPAYYLRVEAIPLSHNGKANTAQLPLPEQTESLARAGPAMPPSNAREALVLRIWSEVLDRQDLRVTDDFFQAGGDSLKAIEVVCKMPQPVNVSKLYEHPVMADFAHHYHERPGRKLLTRLAGDPGGVTTYLLCPYGGGGAYIYRDLADELARADPGCSVYSINLPGHDIGAVSGKFLAVRDAAALILRESSDEIAGKVIVYSHCVGSALGLELTRLFELSGNCPDALVIGGILPPTLVELYGFFFDPWKLVSDQFLHKYLHSLGFVAQQAAAREFLQAFRHDVRAYYRYLYEFAKYRFALTDTPVYTVLGDRDRMTSGATKKNGWERFGSMPGETKLLKGANHYFPHTHAKKLSQLLTSCRKCEVYQWI